MTNDELFKVARQAAFSADPLLRQLAVSILWTELQMARRGVTSDECQPGLVCLFLGPRGAGPKPEEQR